MTAVTTPELWEALSKVGSSHMTRSEKFCDQRADRKFCSEYFMEEMVCPQKSRTDHFLIYISIRSSVTGCSHNKEPIF